MNPFLAQHRAHGNESGGKGFGENHDVRVNRAFVFDGEKFSRAAHAGLDFVVNEQRAVLAAKLLRGEQITGRGKIHALALNRLDDEPCDVAFF